MTLSTVSPLTVGSTGRARRFPNAGLFVSHGRSLMARERKAPQKKKAVVHALPLTKRNYQILGIALVVIALGYVALGQQPWDGFMALTAAPLLLVLGYCILVPFGILYRQKGEQQSNGDDGNTAPTA